VSGVLDDEVLADPIGVIVRLVAEVERGLTVEQVAAVVTGTVGGRAARRRLAQSLKDNPRVLRTGRPPATLSTAKLLLALKRAGATEVSAPRCGGCMRELRYLRSRRGGDWGCSPCLDQPHTCAGCGQHRRAVTVDRHGRHRCQNCPDNEGDPLAELTRLVTALDPGLSRQAVAAAVQQATVRPAGQRRLAWAILERPGLLTGAGAFAPAPAVLRFIDGLVPAGATKVVTPACPRCGQVKTLSKLLDAQRVCRNCFARSAAVGCSRCGAVREPATRDAEGNPLCPNCLIADPINLEDCSGCGRRSKVAVRTGDGPRCPNCRPRRIAVCGICGRTTRCEVSRATGQPWCDRCQQWWAPCAGCGTVAPVRGGTRPEPLCARCVNPDPTFWHRCPACELTWQLSPRPCQRCVLDQKIRGLLGDQRGAVRPELAPLRQALAGVQRPDTALVWTARPKVRDLLTGLAGDDRRLTHGILDEFPADKTLAHLRAVLVATGVLPARDERLVKLERWITAALDAREDPSQRPILHGYAIWHHLRRLRQRLGAAHATHLQALNIRCHLTAATNFLDWLAAENLTLASCTQPDLDRWASGKDITYRAETAHFVRWSVTHRHASRLTFGAIRWEGPRGPHDAEKRWDDARRLLHDDTLTTSDRVAGLLLLLYAQRIATIVKLTTDHIRDDGDQVKIMLGTAPVVLPEPLAGLVRELVATHQGHATIGRPATTPWLFPGGRPGQPIGDDRLGVRLNNIGLHPRQARSTALFTLATEIPAAILARTLGIHIQVAVQWQQAASGDWMTYAADVSRRPAQPAEQPKSDHAATDEHGPRAPRT
jgi:hypothetical protein